MHRMIGTWEGKEEDEELEVSVAALLEGGRGEGKGEGRSSCEVVQRLPLQFDILLSSVQSPPFFLIWGREELEQDREKKSWPSFVR